MSGGSCSTRDYLGFWHPDKGTLFVTGRDRVAIVTLDREMLIQLIDLADQVWPGFITALTDQRRCAHCSKLLEESQATFITHGGDTFYVCTDVTACIATYCQ